MNADDFNCEFLKAYNQIFIQKKENDKNNNYEENNINNNQNQNEIKIQKPTFSGINEEEIVIKGESFKFFKIYKESDYSIFHPANKIEYYENYYINKGIFGLYKNKKKRRREMPDDIRKKIKSRFFKSLMNCINNILENCEIDKSFEYLPQKFICNMNKNENKLMLDKTLKNLLLEINNNNNFLEFFTNENEINKIIYMKINNILNMNIKELFSEYLKSKEYEHSIKELKKEGNYFGYIKDYITLSKDFINYYSN